MDIGNELFSIADTISIFLIDDDYKIDDTLEWFELFQVYIMRYRRIIGIFMLVILLAIMYYFNWKEDSKIELELQSGGGGNNHTSAVAAEMARLRAVDNAQQQFAKEKAEKASLEAEAAEEKSKAEQAEKMQVAKEAKKASRSRVDKGLHKVSKKMSDVGKRIKSSTLGKGASTVASGVSKLSNATGVTKLGKGVGSAIGKSKMGQLAKGKLADIKDMRSHGMSKFGVAKELAGQAGQYTADKFKEFANWLYEILFALAISIAICMIVVPSIAFFALGLICYFLLRKKISSMKAF